MKVLVIQHEAVVHPAAISDWATARGHHLTFVKIFEGDRFPKVTKDLIEFDGVIILGGSMGVYDKDEYPWIEKEEAWIQKLIKNEIPLFGICLGSQLIASSLGANVEPMGYREMGWKEIDLTKEAQEHPLFSELPDTITMMSWHGDRSDLPKGSIPIGSSDACKNQGFIYNDRTVGVQFHPEANPDLLHAFIERYAEKFKKGGPHIQPADKIREEISKHQEMNLLLSRWLDHLFG